MCYPAGLDSATGWSCMVSSPSLVKAAPAAEKISPTCEHTPILASELDSVAVSVPVTHTVYAETTEILSETGKCSSMESFNRVADTITWKVAQCVKHCERFAAWPEVAGGQTLSRNRILPTTSRWFVCKMTYFSGSWGHCAALCSTTHCIALCDAFGRTEQLLRC